jgi:hypothetical protein
LLTLGRAVADGFAAASDFCSCFCAARTCLVRTVLSRFVIHGCDDSDDRWVCGGFDEKLVVEEAGAVDAM